MQRRLLGAFDPIERIWATVSSSRAGIMLPEVEDAGTTEGGREGGKHVLLHERIFKTFVLNSLANLKMF